MKVKLHHRPQDLEGLHRLALRLINADGHEDLLDAVAEEAMQILTADRGLLLLAGDQGGEMTVVRSWGSQPEDNDISRSLLQRVLEGGEPILVPDAQEDAQLAAHESIQRLGVRSVLAAPLVYEGQVRGALYLESTPDLRLYAEEELDIFGRILDLSSRALEANTRQLMLEQRTSMLERDLRSRYRFPGILTAHDGMMSVLETLGTIASTDLPVLIQGESGTGKELLARAVHVNSPFRRQTLQVINCAAIAPTLIESELFGHVRGAFTGASRDKKGLLVEADGGTVFLDEIGELPIELQSKLLRTLQFGEVQPVGSARSVEVKVRFVAATNKRLEDEIRAKRFREDLYFRLNAVVLDVPPLRERPQDIPLLFNHFLRRECEANDREQPDVDPATERALLDYAWPGNVRQLENEAFRALAMAAGEARIEPRHLSPTVAGDRRHESSLQPLAELERAAVEEHLRAAGGNKSQAARTLGISREGLRKKLARWRRDS